MRKLGIIGGTSLAESTLFNNYSSQVISTEWGEAQVFLGNDTAFLQRHGVKRTIPPHKINHRANIAALHKLGVTDIVAVNSTGSLQKELPPGKMIFPDDFFSPWFITTFAENSCQHVVPNISPVLREELLTIAERQNLDFASKGTYVHTLGPRFETAAEIRWLSTVADVVGMTAGGEVPLANELNMNYSLLCMVDNYANGVTNDPLSIEKVYETIRVNLEKVEGFLAEFINSFNK